MIAWRAATVAVIALAAASCASSDDERDTASSALPSATAEVSTVETVEATSAVTEPPLETPVPDEETSNTTAATPIITTIAPTTVRSDRGAVDDEYGCAEDTRAAWAAHDVRTGEATWSVCLPEADYRDVVAIADDLVYVTATRGSGRTATSLIALDVRDGSTVWQRDDLAPYARPLGAPTAIVAELIGDGRSLARLDPNSGETIWATALEMNDRVVTMGDDVVILTGSPPPGWQPEPLPPSTGGPPRSGGYSFYRALEVASGDVRWTAELMWFDPSPVLGSAAVAGGVVATSEGVGLGIVAGDEVWRRDDLPRDGNFGGVVEGIAVWGGQDDSTVAIDVATGETVWEQPGSTAYDNVMALGGGAVFVVDVGAQALLAYEVSDGAIRWQQPFDAQRYSWPWVAGEDVLVTMWTNLDLRSALDGSPLWSTDRPADLFPRLTGAAVADGLVVVGYGYAPSGD